MYSQTNPIPNNVMTQQQGVTPGVSALLGRMRGAAPVRPIRQIQPIQPVDPAQLQGMMPQSDGQMGAIGQATGMMPGQNPNLQAMQNAQQMQSMMGAPRNNMQNPQQNLPPDMMRRLAAFRNQGGPVR